MDGRYSVIVILLIAEVTLVLGSVNPALENNGSDTSSFPSELGFFKYFFQGPSGKDGRDGRDGRDGHDGQQGSDGQRGPAGFQGLPGKVGPRGERGMSGPEGPRGSIGAPGTNPMISGAIYIRWGRSSCPSTASMIYNGFAAGSHYTHTGGGANYLCLPSTPEYDDEYKPGLNNIGGILYQAEYEFNTFPPLASKHDHEVPCSVCESANRVTLLMIPAKKSCPAGWTQEYFGYLMTSNYGQKRSEYVCMDHSPESYSPGSSGSENGALFYPVEGTCGPAMACPPYENGRKLSCSVCTK